KTPIIVNIATPNRKDYVMSPNVKEFYNVYNAKDEFIQGFAGGLDNPIHSSDYLFHFNHSAEQLAREPNAVNIKINKDFKPETFFREFKHPSFGGFLNIIFANHSEYKNPETVKILENVMKQRKGE
ncbi:hypothetical protein, partial [Helicobacter sp. 13S00482-2]|uniref:hypothetical protein n=1 Tax=Helicobacter sp. 13S00482-2 TaxID=1476200 RepID=UPI0015DA3AD7